MKVLFITPSYKPAFIYGGPTFSTSLLAESLRRHGVDVEVITTTANGAEELDVELNSKILVDDVPVRYFKRQSGDHTHLSLGLLNFIWKNHSKYEVFHIHSFWNLTSMLSLMVLSVLGRKVVISPRGMLSDYTLINSPVRTFVIPFLKYFFFRKVFLHATSGYEREQLNRLFAGVKAFVIPNIINTEIKKSDKDKFDIPQYIFLSRIDPKKNLEVIFEALSMIETPYHFHVVGNGEAGYISSLKQKSINLKINDKITWHGAVYGEQKDKLLINSDLLFLCSKDENFANIVLESLLLGTAVMLTKQVALSDFVEENSLGWIVKSNPNEISDVLKNITKEKLEDISLKSPAIVKSVFDEKKLIDDYKDQYHQIIQQ